MSIRSELDAIACSDAGDVSVAMLARKFALKRSYLNYRWPDLCRRISINYRQTAKTKTLALLAQQCQGAAEVVDTLLENAVYPSPRKIREALREKNISLAQPTVRAAVRGKLRQKFADDKYLSKS